MHRFWKSCAAGTLLALLQAAAWAEISPATAQELMQKSGTWTQLADLNTQVKKGLSQSPHISKLSSEDLDRLEQAADVAFAATKLRVRYAKALAQKLDAAQAKDALRWYDSPTGKMITATEEAASSQSAESNDMLQEGNAILAKVSDRRRSQLARAVQLTHVAEGIVTMQVNIAMSIVAGAVRATPHQPPVPLDELRSAFEAQRPQMVADMTGVNMSFFAWMYKSVSDKDLESYLKFLGSRSGTVLSVAMIDALNDALMDAGTELGEGIPKRPPPI